MSAIKYMDIQEFLEGGYLQEANRRFFHPLGLALEVNIAEDGTEILGPEMLCRVWDHRDDPEGMSYGPGVINVEKRAKISDEFDRKFVERKRVLGFTIQYE